MDACKAGLLVFLTLITNISCNKAPFKADNASLTPTEGSCIDIRCIFTSDKYHFGAYWFWIKDAEYSKSAEDFVGTVIYSTNTMKRPISPEYEHRVKYNGSLPWSRNSLTENPTCSISIRNLTKSDSGNYSFRFVGQYSNKWINSHGANVTVKDNPCPITIEKPPVVKESGTITVNCSTLNSCPSMLKIEGFPKERLERVGINTISVSFQVDWEDDGKEITCQTQDNKEHNLIRKVHLDVEYAPKDTEVKSIPPMAEGKVKEGKPMILICSAKGRAELTFTWFINNQQVQENDRKVSGAEIKFQQILASNSGNYYCMATNKHGELKSKPIKLDVIYAPEVEVEPSFSEVTQRQKMTLKCMVKRSNPPPESYAWFKNNGRISVRQTYVVESAMPEHDGVYKCTATNSVGVGTSGSRQIKVKFTPRQTHISIQGNKDNNIKVGQPLTFSCTTVAYPRVLTYSWYRYREIEQAGALPWNTRVTSANSLLLQNVQREDEACYTCNATNAIGTGEESRAECITVNYPPTTPTFSMDSLVSEGQTITISCSVESSPPSDLVVTRTALKKPDSPQSLPPDYISSRWPANTLQYTFNVTPADTGFYRCEAQNDLGKNICEWRKLEVKYSPKHVSVQADPAFEVTENSYLSLRCDASSHPTATFFSWTRKTGSTSSKTDDGSENLNQETWTFRSVRPSDSGSYSCEARNEMGSGKSPSVEVKVRYAPKHTDIKRGAEQQQADGKTSVTLSCSSQSYPVSQFSWYRKTQGGGGGEDAEDSDVMVWTRQNLTVLSDDLAVYYCVAKNEINEKSSELVQVFVNRGSLKAKLFNILIPLIIIIVVFFVYRCIRNKSTQAGTTRTRCCVSLGCRKGARRTNLMSTPIVAEPSRSRDDLFADPPSRHEGQRRQWLSPDRTPASNIKTVYCTVNLPAGEQGPSGVNPKAPGAGQTQTQSQNYAFLVFGKKEKRKEEIDKENVVYAKVTKHELAKKDKPEKLEDYENFGKSPTDKTPNDLQYDSDTSEYEVGITYSKVSFNAKPGHQRARKGSDTSEEETQYSQVKI